MHRKLLASVLVPTLTAGWMTVDESFNLQDQADDARLSPTLYSCKCLNEVVAVERCL